MVSIRAFEWDDYEAVVRLWVEAGLTVGPSESRDGLQLKLERDPELFLVAAVEDRIACVLSVPSTDDGLGLPPCR